jgi:uncharacterized RDD family membrane protein YckC
LDETEELGHAGQIQSPPVGLGGDLPGDEDFLRRQMRRSRLWSRILDLAIFVVPCVSLFLAARLMIASEMTLMEGYRSDTWRGDAAGIFSCAFVLYGIGIEIVQVVMLVRTGQTLGKRFLRIRIVREDGTRAGFIRGYVLRDVVFKTLCSLPVVGLILLVADIVSLRRADGRCIHDRMAGTKVEVVMEGR